MIADGTVSDPAHANPDASAVVAAIVLAGGAGTRLGHQDKPALTIAGVTLLDRALAAVAGAAVVVVGPPRVLDPTIRQTRERPPGAGPAAALAAGLTMLPQGAPDDPIAVLAADLPAVTTATIRRLADQLRPGVDGALLVDGDGREQLLAGVWRRSALLAAVRRHPDWAGRSLRQLLAPLRRTPVLAHADEAADVDTTEDLDRWRGL